MNRCTSGRGLGCPGWFIDDTGAIQPCLDCDLGRSFDDDDAGLAAQAWATHMVPDGCKHPPRPDSCEGKDHRCLGWGVFDASSHGFEIERDDQCGLFETDDEATKAARKVYDTFVMIGRLGGHHVHDKKLLRVGLAKGGALMGAWGHRPRDCDGAWDGFGEADRQLYNVLLKLLHKKLSSRWGHNDRWERVGVAQLLFEERRLPMPKEVVDDIDFLLALRVDNKGWAHPKAALALKAFRAKLQRQHSQKASSSDFGSRVGEIFSRKLKKRVVGRRKAKPRKVT